MKLSKYNVEKKEKDGSYLIYNTITSAILELDCNYANSYFKIEDDKECDKSDLKMALIEGGMLIEDERDEYEELVIKNRIERFSESTLTLTIAPTLACNFCCPYCYEHGREYISMTEKVQNQLVEQIRQKYQHIQELTVSWYGGEPLLALKTIKELTKKLNEVLPNRCKYNADMVTNGYNLTREVAEQLKNLNITYVQVTLDGSRKAHDSRRILHNGNPTFEHILKNLRECTDILNISIRINVDKGNINEALEIFDWLDKYELKGKVGYYLAPVDDINGICNSHICMEKPQYAKEEMLFYRYGIKKGFMYQGVKPSNYGICGAISLNSFVIAPDGELYKCWNDIGYKERSIGNLEDGMKLTNKFVKWLSCTIEKSKECKECKFFPVCYGGCAASKEKICVPLKWNSDEMLELMKEESK